MKIPQTGLKLRHVSFLTENMDLMLVFYRDILAMTIYYQPDANNIYLTNGDDVIALHAGRLYQNPEGSVDHVGFFLPTTTAVTEWRDYLFAKGIFVTATKQHRDNSIGFYAKDPDGNTVEFMTVPSALVFSV